ncbi:MULTISPECIES: ABC transporter ATP-binding protein [unclassified Clostridium]|uniref:ABC transporter ATP-binding protein n=1 Tax=unclassified Clostridium TaxID=2614128 RepID=UPI00215A47C6|nr:MULTISPECIES: ABC transporter ATP-binding protein [unclassified Clostridium]
MVIASILNILSSLLLVLTALMLANLLNVIIAGDVHALIKQIIFMILMWTISIIMDYESKINTAKAVAKMNFTLRYQITDKLTQMDYEQFYKNETGSYVSWLTNDVTQIESTTFNQFFVLISQLSMIIFSLCGLVYIHLWVAMLAIVLCVLMIIPPKLMNKTVEKDSKAMSDQQEEFVKVTKETMMGHEVLYSYNLLSRFKSSILENSKILELMKYTFKKTQIVVNTLISLSNIISQIAMTFITGYLSIKGLTSVGSILPAANLAGSFFGSFATLLNCVTTIRSSKPVLQKFDTDSNQFTTLEMCPPFSSSIELKNVSFGYKNEDVFKNLSLIFENGKKYAIIGKSGSGKTTLIKLILGHLNNYEGNIYIDNVDIKQYSQESIRDNFAYISQNVYIFSGTIKYNITLCENFTEEELDNSLKESCLSDFVLSLDQNLNTFLGEEGNNISGGQKQRLSIARALIRHKPIIIIDEGTSALDKKNAFEVESMLLKNPNFTIILITHRLSEELIDNFDKIIEL